MWATLKHFDLVGIFTIAISEQKCVSYKSIYARSTLSYKRSRLNAEIDTFPTLRMVNSPLFRMIFT